ncbi:MAG: hypothetical protein HY860_04160 [Chlamydiales bacterium]|nr:hypothetical protein [Chlamydiales bacterium]
MDVISRACVYVDKACDYAPGISSFSNAGVLAGKMVFSMPIISSLTEGNPFVEHIKDKSTLRCIGLIICPFLSNGAVAIYDIVNLCAAAIEKVDEEEVTDHPRVQAFGTRPLHMPAPIQKPPVRLPYENEYLFLRKMGSVDIERLRQQPIEAPKKEKKRYQELFHEIERCLSLLTNQADGRKPLKLNQIEQVKEAFKARAVLAGALIRPTLESIEE